MISDAHALEITSILPAHSFVRNFMIFGSASTDAPLIYHLGAALAMLGALAPSTLCWPSGGKPAYAPFWSMLVGETGTTRKTSVVDLANGIMERTAPDRLMAEPQSVEALYESTSLTNPGILMYGEFGEFLSRTGHGSIYAPLRDAFTRLWDCRSFEQKRVRKEHLRVVDPRLSLLAGVAPSFLERHTTQADFANGFLNRWAFFVGERVHFWQRPPGAPEVKQWIEERISVLARSPAYPCAGLTAAADSAFMLWTKQIDDIVKRSTGLTRFLLPRVQAIAEKAALLASFEQGLSGHLGWKIGLVELTFGMRVAESHLISAMHIGESLANNPYERTRASALAVFQPRPGETPPSLTLGEMMAQIQPKIPKKEAQAVVDSLLEEGQIYAHSGTSGNGLKVRYSILPPSTSATMMTLTATQGLVPAADPVVSLPAPVATFTQAETLGEPATFTYTEGGDEVRFTTTGG